jgi:centromeric protein E
VQGYEQNLGAPLRAVREDVEREWITKVEQITREKREKEAWADVLVQQLEKEKRVSAHSPLFSHHCNIGPQARVLLEEERRALAAFVSKFDALGLGGLASAVGEGTPPSKLRGAQAVFAERQRNRPLTQAMPSIVDASPAKPDMEHSLPLMAHTSLLLEETPDADWSVVDDVSFDTELPVSAKAPPLTARDVFGQKENLPASR